MEDESSGAPNGAFFQCPDCEDERRLLYIPPKQSKPGRLACATCGHQPHGAFTVRYIFQGKPLQPIWGMKVSVALLSSYPSYPR